MTFPDLKKQVPSAVKSEWHQHKNGDGWVHMNATVKPKVFVGVDSLIFGGTLYDGTFCGGEFYGGTFWDGEFWRGVFYGGEFHGGEFYGGEFYGGTFWDGEFYDGAFHNGTFYGGEFDGGEFHGGTFYGGTFYDGTFYDGTWRTNPIQIQGSLWFVNQSRPGYIQIGCVEHSFDEWRKRGAALAKEHKATAEQVTEYKRYIDLIVETGVPGE